MTKGAPTEIDDLMVGVLKYQYDPDHKHAVNQLVNSANEEELGNSYLYDANGSQTQRTIGNDIFNLTYNAENRLVEVKKSGAIIAEFTYDADGRRVKSIMDGETRLFAGDHYEVVVNGTETKYYFAGTTMIALRKDGVLNYVMGDHLGSTSVTTDADGVVISELLYRAASLWDTAWGEVRHESGVTATNHTYTGQYSNVNDFSLMHYRARWMDPQLGRFSQPDTIIPSNQGVQAWDRFAYVNNNPVRYTDPTWHSCMPCLVIIGVIATTAYIYSTPLMQELGQQAMVGLENAVQMPKYKDPQAKTIRKINANNNITADSSKRWWPEKGIPCFKNFNNAATCALIVGAIVKSGYDLVTCGDLLCKKPNSETNDPQVKPENTLLPTSECPPYITCPEPQIPETMPPPPLENTPTPLPSPPFHKPNNHPIPI